MFARVLEFSPTSGAATKLVQVIQETALRLVKTQAGCVTAFVERREDVVIGVSVWESKSDAERYCSECYADIENMLRPFLTCAPKLRTIEARKIESVTAGARGMVRQTSDWQGQAGVAMRLTIQSAISDDCGLYIAGPVSDSGSPSTGKKRSVNSRK
jgi:hypothetical protein